MRLKLTLCILVVASAAYAKEPRAYQSAKLLQMDSVSCGTDEKTAQSVGGEIIGADSAHKKTREVLCQEYVLQTEHVVYHVRPQDEKHPVVLPVSEHAQFRFEKDRMLLRVEDLDNKERKYIVVSMTPRTDASSADASTPHLNHLQ